MPFWRLGDEMTAGSLCPVGVACWLAPCEALPADMNAEGEDGLSVEPLVLGATASLGSYLGLRFILLDTTVVQDLELLSQNLNSCYFCVVRRVLQEMTREVTMSAV